VTTPRNGSGPTCSSTGCDSHTGGVDPVSSPNTEDTIGAVARATVDDVELAVGAARRAFDDPTGWSHWALDRRLEAVRRLADELEKRSDLASGLMPDEMGIPVRVARLSGTKRSVALLRYYADIAGSALAEDRTLPATVVRRQPAGVIAAIVPYNGPLTLAMFKVAPALVVGCTVVVEPSPDAPLALYLLADAAEAAGLPPGVINIVTGGQDVGERLVAHPGVDKIAFTGSTRVGRSIAAIAADRLQSVTLKLGGKSAAVLLDDADLDRFVAAVPTISFANAGQNCFCHSRIRALRHPYAEVLDAVASTAAGIRVGDARDDTTVMGPVISAGQRGRIEEYVAAGRAKGARLVTGGGRLPGAERGFFLRPTVFADVAGEMRIAQEEIFGPVICVLPYDDEGDAVRIANDVEYGLAGSVWGVDTDRAERVATRLDVGTVGVNGYLIDYEAPFGGRKLSGLGYELGPQGIDGYPKLQTLCKDPAG